jgi:hypothetical protein
MHCGYGREWGFVNGEVRSDRVDPARWREVLGAPLGEEDLATIDWIAVEEGLNARNQRAVVAAA